MSSSNSMPRGAVRSAAGKSDFTSVNAVTAVKICEAVKLMLSSCQAHRQVHHVHPVYRVHRLLLDRPLQETET